MQGKLRDTSTTDKTNKMEELDGLEIRAKHYHLEVIARSGPDTDASRLIYMMADISRALGFSKDVSEALQNLSHDFRN